MPSIKRLKIEGFKSILNAELNLGKLNVFIGTNGAGKSNLLEAIAILSASTEGGIDHERIARRGARLSSPDVFRSAFKNKKRRATFNIEAEVDDLTYKMLLHSVSEFSYHSESLKFGTEKLAGRSGNGAKVNSKSIDKIEQSRSILNVYRAFEQPKKIEKSLKALEDFAIYAPATPILRGVTSDSSLKTPLGLYGGNLANAIKDIADSRINKYEGEIFRFFELLDWFKSFGVTSKVNSRLISEHIKLGKNILRFKDKYMSEKFNNLYAYDVSEGALYILFVITLLIHKDAPSIIALDNIDNALNPGLVTTLMENVDELVESQDKQVLMTTHNPTTLDGIDLFNPDHRLFVVQRNRNGETEFNQIKPKDGISKEDWQEQYFGMKLSEIWLSGALGALPVGL